MLAFPKRLFYKTVTTCLTLFLFSSAIFSQNITIKATIVNGADSTPLFGISVVELKTKKTTASNDKGVFTLQTPNKNPVLQISGVGFQTTSIIWNSTIKVIKLEPTTSNLEDVVVVGYGTQKKITQTGSSQTVKFDDAVNQPVTNAGQLMYGRFSGIQLTQGSGLPGADESSVTIRGVGTFGAGNPLVVIDNIQYDNMEQFNALSPSDIESISVLKDASASAIYGAKGANGVIIVITKKGKSGAGSIVYNTYVGFQKASLVPQYLNAVDYATLRNEKDINANGPNAPIRYSDANIQAIKDGSLPDQYANTNWANEILKTAVLQNQYLSLSGGNDKSTYRVSLGYLNQDAIVKGKFKSERVTLSFNLNSKTKEWLTISNTLNAYWNKFKGPNGGPAAITGETGIINQFQRSAPTIPVYYSNGEFGVVDGSWRNVNASFPSTHPLRRGIMGDYVSNNVNVANRLGAKIQFNKYLSFDVSGSINATFINVSDFNTSDPTYAWDGTVVNNSIINSLSNRSNFNYRLLNENILRYTRVFNAVHDFSFMAGHSVMYNRVKVFQATLSGFPSEQLQEFDAGGSATPSVTGNSRITTLQSFFSRINYAYNSKYLFEFNIRRDQSSRFGENYTAGYFPSASVGWRINKEKFFRPIKWINELKLRTSYGAVGNDDILDYLYRATYNLNFDYTVGTTQVPISAAAISTLSNPNLKWESVRQLNIAVDATFFKNKLSISADYFIKKSSDVLYSGFPVPASIGFSNLGARNGAAITNKGADFNINYKGSTRKLNYSIGTTLSLYAKNNVTSLGQGGLEAINAETFIRVGQPYLAYFGYKVLGIFQTQDEVSKAPVQFGSVTTAPGDFRYADLSGPNGVPDGVIDAFDRTVIGNPYPRAMYGFNGTLNYKNIDFNITFEGLANVQRVMNDNGQQALEGDRNNALSYWINRWTPQNPSTKYPRLGGPNNQLVSTFYVEDVSYLRLKNLEIGYSVPSKILKKYAIGKIRFYASAQNLLTFTKLKNFDPERAKGGNTDQLAPLYKVYTIGLNVKL